MQPPDKRQTRTIRRRLLAWYRRAARDLPWRGIRDPYAIWASEIMLQQTRVSAVEPYWRRFLKRFPNVGALAAAPLADVLKTWEGMGYYARARNLHKAARILVRQHAARLPQTAEELSALPGIGPYTAGAIASIAFGADEPVLDGNVARVLCRLFALRGHPRRSAAHRRLWDLTRRLIPKGRAGQFNQALMDLGAVVCTPRWPDCPACPLAGVCRAFARGLQQKLPQRTRKKSVPHYDIAAAVVRNRRRVLIDRRRDEGLLGGLWEFPGGKRRRGETLRDAAVREVREETGVRIAVEGPLIVVRHAYSHFRITLHVFTARRISGRARALRCAAVRWVRPEELEGYAFPTANRKVIAALRRGGGQVP